MQKLTIKIILLISLSITSIQFLIGQNKQLTIGEIENLLQKIIDQPDVNEIIKSMNLFRTAENKIRLILDNGIVPIKVNLKYENTVVGFGTKEYFFQRNGDRLIINSVSRNLNLVEIYFSVVVKGEKNDGWTKFIQNGGNWNLEKCILKQKK